MAEPAGVERSRAPESGAGARGGSFSRKIGPLPLWGWAALAGVAAIGYWWWTNHQSSQAAATTATDTSGTDQAGELAAIQSEIQALQGEESQGTAKRTWTRHVSNGKESLDKIAKHNGTSVAGLIAWARESPEGENALDRLLDWAREPRRHKRGVVYYTPAHSSSTTSAGAEEAAGTVDEGDMPTDAGGVTDSAGSATAAPAHKAPARKPAPRKRKAPARKPRSAK